MNTQARLRYSNIATAIVPAGSLDTDPEVTPIHNIYTAYKAPWYVAPSSLVEYDELPIKK